MKDFDQKFPFKSSPPKTNI